MSFCLSGRNAHCPSVNAPMSVGRRKMQLLAELTQRDQLVQYVSKNQAPRQVYLHKMRGTRQLTGVENLFKGSQCYVEVGNDQIHTLLVDEAHRLEERSQYTKKRGNENQVREIIHAATCSVFFIDESQRVTMSDIGSVDEIKRWADHEGSEVIEMELVSQFRCNGSNGYKRLDSGRFQWPRTPSEVRSLTRQQYRWLLEGLSIEQPHAFKGTGGKKDF